MCCWKWESASRRRCLADGAGAERATRSAEAQLGPGLTRSDRSAKRLRLRRAQRGTRYQLRRVWPPRLKGPTSSEVIQPP